MQLDQRPSERQLILMQSFLKDHSAQEVLDVLYQLYRGWAYQVSIKTDREERLRILSCYSDLRDLMEEIGK